MKKVIFCNDVNKLRQLVHNKNEQPIQYLLLGYTKETNKVMHFIKSSSNFVEIKQDLFNNLRRDFQNKFVSFVAELNRENHSLLWWCLNFTNKNPISTQLCTEVFHVLSIVHILQSTNINTLLVITKNADIVRQFYRYARNKPIHVINAISGKVDIIRLLMRYTPCGVLYAFLRMVYCSVYAKIRCPIQLSKHKEYTVVLSLLSEQSFRKNMAYSDVYFGKFIDYLHEKHCDFINVMIIRPLVYRRLLKKAWSRAVQIPIFPLEYFLGIKELLLCFAKALLKYFSQIKVKAGIEIDGINLAYLVKKTIRNDYMTPSFFDNIRVYFAIKVLAQKLLLKRFFYPFENRPFEKMVVCALREISPDTHITGYQHAALSLRHTNFLLGKDEYVFTPLPDSIITMGQITKDVMKEYGNFPEHLVKVGCALRQAPFKGNLKDKKARIKNMLGLLNFWMRHLQRILHTHCG